jgi:hypothetical protein
MKSVAALKLDYHGNSVFTVLSFTMSLLPITTVAAAVAAAVLSCDCVGVQPSK